jgi:phage shock protein PspC (stress-responsive transcriptional regulator)
MRCTGAPRGVLAIVPGFIVGGLLAYVIAWAVLPAGAAQARVEGWRRLFRSVSDRRIAGVCGGLGEHLGVDSTVVRLAWVILSIYPGAIICGVFAYLIAWFIIPPSPVPALQPSPSAS